LGSIPGRGRLDRVSQIPRADHLQSGSGFTSCPECSLGSPGALRAGGDGAVANRAPTYSKTQIRPSGRNARSRQTITAPASLQWCRLALEMIRSMPQQARQIGNGELAPDGQHAHTRGPRRSLPGNSPHSIRGRPADGDTIRSAESKKSDFPAVPRPTQKQPNLGVGEDQHTNSTNKMALPDTRRRNCYDRHVG
jgi:hypothetical protein